MCIALEGKVLKVKGKEALVDFGNIRREVIAEFLKVQKGDKVMVFNNFIIERWRDSSKPAGGFNMAAGFVKTRRRF